MFVTRFIDHYDRIVHLRGLSRGYDFTNGQSGYAGFLTVLNWENPVARQLTTIPFIHSLEKDSRAL